MPFHSKVVFGEDGPAQQTPLVCIAHHGDDRDEGVAEGVLDDDPALVQPLGPSGANVVGVQGLQGIVAREKRAYTRR